MSELHCPKCACDYCYHDGEMNICPECAYEWRDGDASTGADHNIDCKIEGFGGMMLKSEYVKKA